MKYQKKIQLVDAQPFEWDMEDGIIRYNSYIPKDVREYREGTSSTQYPGYLAVYDKELANRSFDQHTGYVPYINTLLGYEIVHQGDYIVTDGKGNRQRYNAKQFALEFELITAVEGAVL